MIKALYTFGVLVLICAGILFVLCGMLWRNCASQDQQEPLLSVVERIQQEEDLRQESNQEVLSPLVKQATDFALYINPPEPPRPQKTPEQRISLQVSEPVAVPSGAQPRFSLLATSCYRSRPEKSVALIWEPGRGEHWVVKGDQLGHFVVESIKEGAIVCRNGDQLHEVAIEMKPPVQIAQSRRTVMGLREEDINPSSSEQVTKMP